MRTILVTSRLRQVCLDAQGLTKCANYGGCEAWYGGYVRILSGLPKSTEHPSRGYSRVLELAIADVKGSCVGTLQTWRVSAVPLQAYLPTSNANFTENDSNGVKAVCVGSLLIALFPSCRPGLGNLRDALLIWQNSSFGHGFIVVSRRHRGSTSFPQCGSHLSRPSRFAPQV